MASFVFSERQYQSYEMDFRLFIEGVEVTDWCHDVLGLTYAGTGGMNTLSFTLANPDDVWAVTSENLAGHWTKSGTLYSEEGKLAIYKIKKAREDAALSIINANSQKKISIIEVGIYNLGPDQLIFHKHDCVRLFIRNPLTYADLWMPAFTGFIDTHPFQDDYVRGGTPLNITCYDIKGLMKRMRVASNPMPSGGMKHQAKSARETGSQSQFLRLEGVIGPEAGMFEDLFSASGINSVLAGRNFEQAMRFLFFGEGGALPGGSVNKFTRELYGGLMSTTMTQNKDGGLPPQQSQKPSVKEKQILDEFDKLNVKNIVQPSGGYDPKTGNPLNQTQYDAYKAKLGTKDRNQLIRYERRATQLRGRLVDAETRRRESTDRKKAANQPTEKNQRTGPLSSSTQFAYKRGHVGRMEPGPVLKYPGTNLESWHNLCLLGNSAGAYLTYEQVTTLGRGTVLDPVQGSPYNGRLMMLLPDSGIPASGFAQVDLDGVKDFSQGVSFQTRYELVDHICEQIDYQWYVTPNGDVAMEFPMYDFTPKSFGAYKGAFTLDAHAISASVDDEATDIPTAMIVTAQESVQQAGDAAQTGANATDPNRLVVYAPLLAARLGAHVEQISSPVSVGGSVSGGGGKMFGGGLKGAEAWALLQMQKRLGQSSTLSVPTPFRPWLLPNRPFHHVPRERIGITSNIQHSLTINETCQSTPVLWFVKKKHSDGKYRYPTSGGENMPINYSTGVAQTGDITKSGIIIRKSAFSGSSEGTPTDKKTVSLPPQRGSRQPKIKPKVRWLTGESIGTGTVKRLDAGGPCAWFHQEPDIWVIHCGQSGGNIKGYLSTRHPTIPRRLGDGRAVSVHFVVEPNGQIYQMLPLDVQAAHAGYGGINPRSLSMEFRGPATKIYNNEEINAFIGLVNRTIQIFPTLKIVYGHVDLIPKKRSDPGKKYPWSRMKVIPWKSPKGHF
jgi:hypothetical protein